VVDLGAEMQPKPADAPEPDTGDEVPQAPDAAEPDPTPEPVADLAKPVPTEEPEEHYAAAPQTPQAWDALADAITRLGDRLPNAEEAQEARRDLLRGLTRRARWGLHNGTAAAAGQWGPAVFGAPWAVPSLVTDLMDQVSAEASTAAALVLGGGLTVAIWAFWDIRTVRTARRHAADSQAAGGTTAAWHGVAWIARIPLASAVLGLLLWDPSWHALNL
jgi:hypothetical protein